MGNTGRGDAGPEADMAGPPQPVGILALDRYIAVGLARMGSTSRLAVQVEVKAIGLAELERS